MTTDTTIQIAKKIQCFGIAQNLEARIAHAQQAGSTYDEFIRQLLEDEHQERQARTAKRMITRAKFRHAHALENWDMSYDRGLSKRAFAEISRLHFYTNRENLIIMGSTGSGKSHLAVSLGRQLCHNGIDVRFFSSHLLFEEIQAQRAAGRYLNFINNLSKINTLILDDFGLRNYSHDEATSLLEMLEERYQKGILIVTSQVKSEGWRTLFEDKVIADAIIDRLCNPAQNVELKGISYRTKITKQGHKHMD